VCILICGFFSTAFSFAAYQDEVFGLAPGDTGSMYSRDLETTTSLTMMGIWLFGNAYYWYTVHLMVMAGIEDIGEHEQLHWMAFKKKSNEVYERQIRDD